MSKSQRLTLTFSLTKKSQMLSNKAGYTATLVACGWAGTIFEVTRSFGQEQQGKKKNLKKSKM